jgi:hypothetical protein
MKKYKYKFKKIFKSKKHKKRKLIKTLKGGAYGFTPSGYFLDRIKLLFQYGALSIATAPLYIISLLANLPFNTLNNISGKRLDKVDSKVVDRQLYKYLFTGYEKKPEPLIAEDFKFPEGSRYIEKKQSVFVECDDCRKKEESEKKIDGNHSQNDVINDQKGGGSEINTSKSDVGSGILSIESNISKNLSENINTSKSDVGSGTKTTSEKKETSKSSDIENSMLGLLVSNRSKKLIGINMFSDMLGLLDQREKIKYVLKNFFEYLYNLQMKDKDRRNLLHSTVMSLTNKDSIIKCIIIFNTIFDDNECETMMKEIDEEEARKATHSTSMINPSLIRVVNPFSLPGEGPIDFKKSIKCLIAHLKYKEFGTETKTQDCSVSCPKCTLKNSVISIGNNYVSSIKSILKGDNKDLDILNETFFSIFINNYSYIPDGLTNDSNIPDGLTNPSNDMVVKQLKELKEKFKKALNNLPIYTDFNKLKTSENFNIDLSGIIIDTKFVQRYKDDISINIVKDNFPELSDEDIRKKLQEYGNNNIYELVYGEDVMKFFKKLLCRYNLIYELKKRYITLCFKDYYTMVSNNIKFPNDPLCKEIYINWANDFLVLLFRIHGINYNNLQLENKESYLFSLGDINNLVDGNSKVKADLGEIFK